LDSGSLNLPVLLSLWLRFTKTRRKLSELHRKQAAYRKSLPGNLANHVFSLGITVKLEKIILSGVPTSHREISRDARPG